MNMRFLIPAYNSVIVALACIAGVMVAGIFASVVYDVTLRMLGLQPPYWTSAATEYALLYVTMLAAPWLVRRKGHVFVQLVNQALPAGTRRWLEKAVYVICIAISLTMAAYSLLEAIQSFERGEYDVRSIAMPLWLLYAPLPLGFVLTAAEFFRFLIGVDSMYVNTDSSTESL
jgi:C4-dicarboxylate transporter, DctQ subunit